MTISKSASQEAIERQARTTRLVDTYAAELMDEIVAVNRRAFFDRGLLAVAGLLGGSDVIPQLQDNESLVREVNRATQVVISFANNRS